MTERVFMSFNILVVIEKNHALLTIAKKLQDTSGLDLIFCYVYDDFLLPKYAKALSCLNVHMVNYNVDMQSHWIRQIRIAPYFDIMLCAERRNMEHLACYAKLQIFLEKNQIETRPIICGNLTRQPALKHHFYKIHGKLTGADQVMDCGLYWGMHPMMHTEQINYVIDKVLEFFNV